MWKKISSEVIHKNPWYLLKKDKVIRPDGNPGDYFLVDGIDSVAVIAEDKKGYIYLVGQSRYPLKNKFSWELISGGLKKGQSPLGAAKRELKEETGIIAKSWKSLGYCNPIPGYSSENSYIFWARNLKLGKNHPEGTENIRIKKMKIKNILAMIKANKITSGLTVYSINKYLIHRNKIKL